MDITTVDVQSILTRTGGFLRFVSSHSLQPYRGCSFGRAMCGVGCYVRQNGLLTKGREWGSFLEVRANAAEVYDQQFAAEQAWGRRRLGRFSIFCSSSTDPFLPQEQRFGITRSLLDAMIRQPPDELILQTHSHRVLTEKVRIESLAGRCRLRVHLSIETDRERIEGLPPPASSVADRLAAARALHLAGIQTVVVVAPLLPIEHPGRFFARIAEIADQVIIDHFIEGDGTKDGARTKKTHLPIVMEQLLPGSASLAYRDEIVAVAREIMPGRVGVGSSGFAGEWS